MQKLIKNLPRDVRREKAQEIKTLQRELSVCLNMFNEETAQQSATRDKSRSCSRSGSRAGSLTQRETRSNKYGRDTGSRDTGRLMQSARQLRDETPSVTRKDFSFSPTSRTPSTLAAHRSISLPQSARTLPGVGMELPPKTRRSSASDSQLYSARSYEQRDSTTVHTLPNDRRPSRSSTLTSSVFSGMSTPVAGRTWGHLTRVFGNGLGKAHFEPVNHIATGYQGVNDIPGTHGHAKDDDIQGALERGIGRGRRKFNTLVNGKTHLNGGRLLSRKSVDTKGDHNRRDAFINDSERGLCWGRKHFPVTDLMAPTLRLDDPHRRPDRRRTRT